MTHRLHDQPLSSDYFRKAFTLISSGTTTQNIYDSMVKPSMVHVYTNISVEDLDGSYTELRLGINSGGSFHNYLEHDDPQAAFLYWAGQEIMAHEHERLQLQLIGVAANDMVKFFLHGYIIEEVNAKNRRLINSRSINSSEAEHNDHSFAVN